jgi:hypothetical protein
VNHAINVAVLTYMTSSFHLCQPVVQTSHKYRQSPFIASSIQSSPALMSLLQDVLKSQSYTHDLNGLSTSSRQSQPENDSDDELVGVVCLPIVNFSANYLILLEFSLPGTPVRSRAPSRPSSRPVSPSRRGPTRSGNGLSSKGLSDPLKAFPTQVSQNIFRWLGISELATCARVSRKWNKSQTLNYSKSYL